MVCSKLYREANYSQIRSTHNWADLISCLNNNDSTAWYIDKSETTVYYRPTIHADRLLLHWSNAINHYKCQGSSLNTPIAMSILESHSDEIKVCSTCHTASAKGINWAVDLSKPVLDGFGKFSHEFHVGDMTKSAECTTCHTLQSPVVKGYSSNFQSHDKQMCATCHTPEKVSSTCTTCHSYHMEKP